MNETVDRPAPMRRLSAIAALLLVAGVLLATVVIVLNDPLVLAGQALLLVVVVTAAWIAMTRASALRWIAAIIAIVGIVGSGALELSREGHSGASLIVRVALLLVAAGLARYALSRDVRTLQLSETPGTPVPGATRGALIMNLKSGGGKAERFHLPKECRARGIEPIVLAWGDGLLQLAHDAEESRARGIEPIVQTWGDDLSQLAHHAIDRGVDVIGMAGGDGSQALVANIAAERGVPMVIIPAGTRNHFALDLGLDRDDVVGALDAYGPAVERRIDLGDVNGRVFVNNVSMGLYAVIVESSEYRDAKMETTLAALPQMLGPNTK
ncbi:MAG TPA: diacylglycerol kinase family protein, partial [Thermoleophilia bacterium]|nr:diacylglycerol kinase family protein [Thermoleophilia bacterium]